MRFEYMLYNLLKFLVQSLLRRHNLDHFDMGSHNDHNYGFIGILGTSTLHLCACVIRSMRSLRPRVRKHETELELSTSNSTVP